MRPSPTNWPQVYRFLLKQTSINYWEMRRPFPANQPQSTDPYYTKPVEPIGKWGGTSTNWSQVYRFLLHQTSISYSDMRRPSPTGHPPSVQTLLDHTSRTYWEMRRPSPTDWPQVYRTILHQTSITYWEMTRLFPMIKPKFTDSYYTKLV